MHTHLAYNLKWLLLTPSPEPPGEFLKHQPLNHTQMPGLHSPRQTGHVETVMIMARVGTLVGPVAGEEHGQTERGSSLLR